MIIAGEKQDNGYEMLDYPGEVSYREWIYKVENCFRNQFRGSSWECWGNAGESKENIHMLFLIFPFALRLFYTIFSYIEIFYSPLNGEKINFIISKEIDDRVKKVARELDIEKILNKQYKHRHNIFYLWRNKK